MSLNCQKLLGNEIKAALGDKIGEILPEAFIGSCVSS
jgi:hypothetical protein